MQSRSNPGSPLAWLLAEHGARVQVLGRLRSSRLSFGDPDLAAWRELGTSQAPRHGSPLVDVLKEN